MENNLIIITQNNLRSMSKVLNALALQVTQLSQIIKELRLKLLNNNGGKNDK
jgi:hypothetical protein